ncbi:MAG: type II toxin-antitoxin system RelB/DinJ family antitoxin [Oscillospiraceae bacterium]|nr:type II toxin-antitoxin system RelB/DinJ family antitoxin [Oscillospiraceae bacterium]
MAQTTQVNFRVDVNVKRDAERVLDELGLPLSTAFTIFLKAISRKHGLPLDMTVDPFYLDSNMRHLQQSIQQLEDGRVITKTMEELEDMAGE